MTEVQPILLGQLVGMMPNSQRLHIVEEHGQELYKGFVANFDDSTLDKTPVLEVRLTTDVFTKAKRTERMPLRDKMQIATDNLSDFRFSDLDCVVYQKIVLQKK